MTATSQADPIGRADQTPLGTKLFWRYGRLIGPLLAVYLLFDRAVAYVHIPGTPIYLGECLLLLGVVAALAGSGYVHAALRDDPILTTLAAIVAWAVLRSVPNFHRYGLFTVRDSALWYYSLFAVFIVAASLASPNLPNRLAAQLQRFVPWLLVWLPLAVVMPLVAGSRVRVPGTTVSVLSHKDGNVAVAAFLALAALWLLPDALGRTLASRQRWSLLAAGVVLAAGTQNRGGLVAVTAGGAVGLAFVPQLAKQAAKGLVLLVVALIVAAALSVRVSTANGRSLSTSQLVANLESLAGVNHANNLQGTVQARKRQWQYVIHVEATEGKLAYGFGFGPNVGFGEATGSGDTTLRGPHNSHVDMLARVGLVGLALWIFLWLAWFWRLAKARQRFLRERQHGQRGLVEFCFVVAVAVLLNAYFDPTLEGAQVAAVLWTIFGLGLVVSRAGAGRDRTVAEADERARWPRPATATR